MIAASFKKNEDTKPQPGSDSAVKKSNPIRRFFLHFATAGGRPNLTISSYSSTDILLSSQLVGR